MSNIYLFYGEEKYDINMQVEKIKKEFSNLEIGVNLFYVSKESIDELESITQGVTFFGSEKLVIIKDTKLKFNISYISNLDQDIKVIILEDNIDKRTSEYKTISKIAECREFKHLDDKQMASYIINMLRRYKVDITSEDAEYFQNVCGNDKSNNINELQKLVIYLDGEDGEKKVTKEIIDKVCSKTLNAKIFDLLSKIVNKQKESAILMLDELLEQKESIIKIYIMLYKQVKQIYMIKYLNSKNVPNIAQELKIHPFVFKNLNISANKYTLEKLKNIIYEFDLYDEKTKNGEMDFEVGLKKIIATM
ncbi:MAG: DNA polymerase III subunit delta [Clostridia bacterium]